VPVADWLRVKMGEKTAFRTFVNTRSVTANITRAELPTPVVAYAHSAMGYDCALMLLEGHRVEPVFEATQDPDAIAREGFANHHHFRRYWRKRRGGVFVPSEMVHVWELRPWEQADFDDMGRMLLDRLYGDFYGSLKPRQLQS
jgi:hypothetical protein